jgi:hypothetical protein
VEVRVKGIVQQKLAGIKPVVPDRVKGIVQI